MPGGAGRGYLAHAPPPQTAAAAGARAVAWMATGSVAAESDGGSGTSGNERRHGRRRQQWGGAWPWENTRQGVRAGQCGVGRRFGGLTLMFRQEMDVRGNSLKLVWINPRGPAATRSTTPRLAHGMVRWYLTTRDYEAAACGVSHPFCAVSHCGSAQSQKQVRRVAWRSNYVPL